MSSPKQRTAGEGDCDTKMPEVQRRYEKKDEDSTGVLVVEGRSFYVTKELLGLFSPVLKEEFRKAERGVLDELPVIKLEDLSADDTVLLLDMMNPQADILISDTTLYTLMMLGDRYQISKFKQQGIHFMETKNTPKMIYRQIADKYKIGSLQSLFSYKNLATRMESSEIEKERKNYEATLDSNIPANIYKEKFDMICRCISRNSERLSMDNYRWYKTSAEEKGRGPTLDHTTLGEYGGCKAILVYRHDMAQLAMIVETMCNLR